MSEQPDFDFSLATFFVVEDDKTSQLFASKILKKLGVSMMSFASNGAEALDQIDDAEIPADVMLVDLHMPEMDGVEFLRNLADRGFPNRIILLSAADEITTQTAESLAAYRGLNILGRIAKPLTIEGLRDILIQPE